MTLTPREKLAAAVARVIDPVNGWMPYFAVALTSLERREAAIPTLAVSKNGVLLWGRAFVEASTVDELAAGLAHETLHVVLGHHARTEALIGFKLEAGVKVSPDLRHKFELANLAQDACINEGIRKARKIPDWWVTPESLGQPVGLVFEQRYALLLQKHQEEKAQKTGGEGAGEGDGDDGEGEGDGKGDGAGKAGTGKCGAGHCGSCAGNPVDGEPADGAGGRTVADMERIRKVTAEAVQAYAAKGRGTVSAELDRWAAAALAPAKIDWRTYLTATVRDAVAYRPGAVDLTWRKPSRRQAGLGYGFGVPVAPALHSPVPRVGVVLDTSGSMGTAELNAAIAEVEGVLAEVGAEITFTVCDAHVHGIKEVATLDDAVGLLTGGGGTDMRPAFEALAARPNPPQVVIVLTDGLVGDGVPTHEPAWCRTVWVLLGPYRTRPCAWGEQIEVDDATGEVREVA